MFWTKVLSATSIIRIMRYWQVALMAATSVALSVASGWTTWDGLSNFTSDNVLSLLITFGIQGVLLTTAWIVSSAHTINAGQRHVPRNRLSGPVRTPHFRTSAQSGTRRTALFAVWLMLVVSMSASLFFSFDSLFEKVFNDTDRTRAGTIRTQNSVAEVLAAQETQLRARHDRITAEFLQSGNWVTYANNLRHLKTTVRAAADQARKAERAVTMDSNATRLRLSRTMALRERALQNLTQQMATLQNAIQTAEQTNRSLNKQIAKTELTRNARQFALNQTLAAAEREERGLSSSRRVGKGPRYKLLMARAGRLRIEIKRLASDLELLQSSLAKSKTKLQALNDAISGRMTEKAVLLTRLNELRTRIQSETDRTKNTVEHQHKLVAASVELDRVLNEFISAPAAGKLLQISTACNALRSLLQATGTPNQTNIKGRICDTNSVGADLVRVTMAGKNLEAFRRTCSADQKIGTLAPALAMQKAQSCLIQAALPPKQTRAYAARLQEAALRRDDVAHRFVVSSNAIFDKNPLAYLALLIAVTIDGLVLASSFCGSHAIAKQTGAASTDENRADRKTPLVSALFGTIPAETAALLFQSLQTTTAADGDVKYRIDLSKISARDRPSADRIMALWTSLCMTTRLGETDRYDIKHEVAGHLIETIANRCRSAHGNTQTDAMNSLFRIAMISTPHDLIQQLLDTVRPVPCDCGYTHRIEFRSKPDGASAELRRLLNLGVAHGSIITDATRRDVYFISRDYLELLANYATSHESDTLVEARALSQITTASDEALSPPGVIDPPKNTNSDNAARATAVARPTGIDAVNDDPAISNTLSSHTPIPLRPKRTSPPPSRPAPPVGDKTRSASSQDNVRHLSTRAEHTATTRPSTSGPSKTDHVAAEHTQRLLASINALRKACPELDERYRQCERNHGALSANSEPTTVLDRPGAHKSAGAAAFEAFGAGAVLEWLHDLIAKEELLADFNIGPGALLKNSDKILIALQFMKNVESPAIRNQTNDFIQKIEQLKRKQREATSLDSLIP